MNKKTIIFSLILLVILGGVFWYLSEKAGKFEMASIKDVIQKEDSGSNSNDSGDSEKKSENQEIVIGNPAAPVTMVDYSQYTCPHCVSFHKSTFSSIMENYVKSGKVKVLPRRLGPSALVLAVVCGNEQGKFQETDDYIFNHIDGLLKQIQGTNSADEVRPILTEWLNQLAQSLNLELTSFNQCLNSTDGVKQIQGWLDEAHQNEISGTPTFLNKKQKIIGNQPYTKFEEVIEGELNKK